MAVTSPSNGICREDSRNLELDEGRCTLLWTRGKHLTLCGGKMGLCAEL